MTQPRDPNDSWAELYRELGVDDMGEPKSPPTPPEPIPQPELIPAEPIAISEECIESEEVLGSDSDDLEELSDDELESAGSESATDGDESDPGQKKRRRRRRRRKKKGSQGTTPTDANQETTPETEGESTFEDEPSETGFAEVEEEEVPAVVSGSEEDLNSEMTRDIIANWNVPSWEQIIAGLYRPER